MLRFLVPRLPRGELAAIARWSIAGALVAGAFGVIHDQVTYTISPEYFTRMKFDQFAAFRSNLPPRGFVAVIGFFATWWFGLISTWLLARAGGPAPLHRRIPRAWLTMVMGACLGGAMGFIAGPPAFLANPAWREAAAALGVTDVSAFARVAGIHLGGYLGAALATLGSWIHARWMISQTQSPTQARRTS